MKIIIDNRSKITITKALYYLYIYRSDFVEYLRIENEFAVEISHRVNKDYSITYTIKDK